MKRFCRSSREWILFLTSGLLMLSGCSPRISSDYRITPVAINRITLTDSFWAPRIQKDIDITIPAVLRKLYETGRVKNFLNAGSVLNGKTESEEFCTAFPFDDSDVYKLIDAGAYALLNLKNDPGNVRQ